MITKEEKGKQINIAICVAHPIQHEIPLYQELSKQPEVNLTVIYFSDYGVKSHDAYGIKNISYGIPMLEGYRYEFVKNRSPFSNFKLKYINPDITKVLAAGNFDHVVLYGYFSFTHFLVINYCRKHKIPVYLRAEGESIQPVSRLKSKVRSVYLPRIFRKFDGFLAICQANRMQYEEFGVSPARISDVPQTINDDFFAGYESKNFEQLKAKYGIKSGEVVFVFGSKQRVEKRPMDAIKAFCALPSESNARLLMLSDGPCRAECEAFAKQHDAKNRIVFTGYVSFEEMRDLFALSDVLLITSYETIGATLYQALFSGLAILSSDMVPGWLDVVKPGYNGLIYRAAWLEALIKNIIALSQNPDLVRQMKENSRTLAAEYTSASSARKLVNELLAKN